LTPSRGLARLLRRNPTEPERKFWDALTRDRRFAGYGFKRQVPIGPHIPDVVSFPLRMVIEIVPGDETGEAATAREARRAWLESRDYRVIDIRAQAVEREISTVLSDLAKMVIPAPPAS
jgi:tRNA/rRNA methyltransferase